MPVNEQEPIKEEAFPKLKAPLNSVKLGGIRLWLNEDATDKETIGNYSSKIEGDPPESNGVFWGLKHTENGRNFFHAFLTYTF